MNLYPPHNNRSTAQNRSKNQILRREYQVEKRFGAGIKWMLVGFITGKWGQFGIW
jgi:hypothetical protein